MEEPLGSTTNGAEWETAMCSCIAGETAFQVDNDGSHRMDPHR